MVEKRWLWKVISWFLFLIAGLLGLHLYNVGKISYERYVTGMLWLILLVILSIWMWEWKWKE